MAESDGGGETVMLTVFLKDTQQRTLKEMIANLERNGFFAFFPPDGVEVVSWQQLMGFGHVVTLEAPPGKLREINGAIESSAYGTFVCEVHVGYDFRPTAEHMRRKAAGA